MLSKREMDIIRNLAKAQQTRFVELPELVNEAVVAVLEERRRVGIANDGILIAIAKRAMINYKLHCYVPATIPKGSRYASYKKRVGTRASLIEVEMKPDVKRSRVKMDVQLAVKKGVEEVKDKVDDDDLVDAILEGCSIEEIVSDLSDVTVNAVRRARETAKKIFRKLGFKE